MEKKLIKCGDCKCSINGVCYRFPPMPHFATKQWGVRRPNIRYNSIGCFAGIPKESDAQE